MRTIILPARPWRAFRALWLLMALSLVVDLCAVVLESELLQDTAATAQSVSASDWLSFSSEAVGLSALCGLLLLLRRGAGLTVSVRRACSLEAWLTLACLVASKLPALVFGPFSIDDGHWLADLLDSCADLLLPVVPAGMVALFLLGAALGGRVGRLSALSAASLALLVPVLIGFVANAMLEHPVAWVGVTLGALLGVLCLVPVAALRLMAGGEEEG